MYERDASGRQAGANPMLRRASAACAAYRGMLSELFDPYRPERHYMRGPGPKWHAKHSRARGSDGAIDAAFARARA